MLLDAPTVKVVGGDLRNKTMGYKQTVDEIELETLQKLLSIKNMFCKLVEKHGSAIDWDEFDSAISTTEAMDRMEDAEAQYAAAKLHSSIIILQTRLALLQTMKQY